MRRLGRLGAALLAVGALATLTFAGSSAGHGKKPKPPEGPLTKKAIMFAANGMRPDLMERYADKGIMPTFKDLMKRGVRGKNGLLQGFPPNTGVGWHTLATGTWPGKHGSTNNTFHRTGTNFDSTTSFSTNGVLPADTILQSAERAGKKVLSMEWVAARALRPELQGPLVDFRTFIGGRGIVLNYDLPGQPALANSFGVQYQRQTLAAAAGWTNVPASFSPAKQTTFTHANAQIPGGGVWDLYIYDSTNNGTVNYDHVLIVNSADAKDGSKAVANLTRGEWADAKLKLVSGSLVGKTAGFYAKLIDLNADASQFRLYFTSVQRLNASYNALGPAGSDAFVETLEANFPTSTAADFAPLEALIVDEDTYVKQGLMWADAHFAYLNYIVNTLGYKPDVLFLGSPVTDEFSHQFLGLLTKTERMGDQTVLRRRQRRRHEGQAAGQAGGLHPRRVPRSRRHARARTPADGQEGHDRVRIVRPWLRAAVAGDQRTEAALRDDGPEHGDRPRRLGPSERQSAAMFNPPGGTPLSNCRAQLGAADLAKACWAGGTTQFYVNPTLPAGVTYEAVRNAIIAKFSALTDPATPGRQVILKVMKKEELRNVDGTDSLHPSRSGDVVVVSRPPYQFDAATAGRRSRSRSSSASTATCRNSST